MRLIRGKKPPPSKRDNNGKLITAGPLMVSPFFPDWLVPSKFKLEKHMEKVKLQVLRYQALEKVIIWEKPK